MSGRNKKLSATLAAVAAGAALGAAAAPASAATSLIAAYDHYVQGQGFDIGLVDLGTGANIAVPAGVNTADDEIHPALTADGRRLVFTRTRVLPLLNGDVVPPSDRTLMMVDRSTGTFRAPVAGQDLKGFGATLTPAEFGEDQLAFGLRPPFPRDGSTPSRIVTGAARTSTEFLALERLHTTVGGPVANESSSSTLDVPEATILKRTGPNYVRAHTRVRFNPATGQIQDTKLLLETRSGISATGSNALELQSKEHPAPRQPDGYLAMSHIPGVVGDIFTLNYPASTTPERAPQPINSAPGVARVQNMPTWSPDGIQLAFVRHNAVQPAQRQLLVFDNTPGIQTIMNAGINLGAPAPTDKLARFHDTWGGISVARVELPDSTNVSCTSNCLRSLSSQLITSTVLSPTVQTSSISAGSIGILLARVTGTKRSLGKRVPRLKPLGRVPLGKAKRGRNRFRWNGRVGNRRLKPGTYVLTFRQLTNKGRIQSVSKSIRFKVNSKRRIIRPKVIR